jgi:uncharacterized tellurite resistance protein B-like protein
LTAREFAMLEMYARMPVEADERAREFMDSTTEEERVRFMDVLFAVAVADGLVSELELSEIGSIAAWLYLPRKVFIDAKVRVPAEQRAE